MSKRTLIALSMAVTLLGGLLSAAQLYEARWWSPAEARALPPGFSYDNAHGRVTTLNQSGVSSTRGHSFFEPIGSNGRACVTCHQPSDAMALSLDSIKERWQSTGGKDPLFAMIDGANCPNLPPAEAASHSLLLERGLIRVARPWPPRDAAGRPITPQFTIEVLRDPTGCNTGQRHGLRSANPEISVYRRPRPATNIKYLTAVGFTFEPKNGQPLPRDAQSGERTSGNLLADARVRTLEAQAIDALRTHLELHGDPRPEQLRQIIEFIHGLYSAQSHDAWGSALNEQGARGGPEELAAGRAGELQSTAVPIWNEFYAWKNAAASAENVGQRANMEQRTFRASVARGAELFSTRQFLVSDSAGINNMGFGNPVRNPCAFCHNMQRTGMDVAPGQVDLGTTNMPYANASPELPLFKLTCDVRFPAHPHLGRVVYTQDPGYALTTGKCIDIGKITMQSMRGLAARAPYFANGSARTLAEVVDFYDRRYPMRLTAQEKQDLVNLMSVL